MAKLDEDDNPKYYQPPFYSNDWPVHVVNVPRKAKSIAAGGEISAALLEDDTIVTWGMGSIGDLGRPTLKLDKKTPLDLVVKEYLTPLPPQWAMPSPKRSVLSMACGGFHILVSVREQEDGRLNVYSSGLNQYGQLGLGDLVNRDKLTKIEHFEGCDITTVEGGGHFSAFVDITNKILYTCGRSDYGSLGHVYSQPAAGSYESIPIRIPLVYDLPKGSEMNLKENCIVESEIDENKQPEIEQISCGNSHMFALTKCGDLYAWGFGEMCACGLGPKRGDVYRPEKVPLTKLNKDQSAKYTVKFISGGGQHSVAVIATKSTAIHE
jgi:alpha-tubulin suppressor-like RCC1 family protein